MAAIPSPLKVTKMAKNAIFFHTLTIIAAGAVLGLCIYQMVTVPTVAILPQMEFVSCISLCACVILVSLFSIVGLVCIRRTSVHLSYIGLGLLLIGCGVLGAILINTLSDTAKQTKHLSHQWNQMKNRDAHAVQLWGKCCGFNSLRDRIQPPCPAGAIVGCAQALLGDYQQRRDSLFWPLILLSVALALSLVTTSMAISRWWSKKSLIGVDENQRALEMERELQRKEPKWTIPIFK